MKIDEKVDCLLADAEELLRSRGDVPRLRAERRKRLEQVFDRWNELAHKAASLTDDEERGRVDEAVEQANQLAGPYDQWLRDLADGCCRLPELSAEAMRDLLSAWLHPLAEQCGYAPVCTACGLEYPHTKQPAIAEMMPPPAGQGKPPNPDLFSACPHCGSPAHGDGMTWSHRIDESKYAWMDLDGYAGQPIQDSPERSESA